jgi:hypothetical protein
VLSDLLMEIKVLYGVECTLILTYPFPASEMTTTAEQIRQKTQVLEKNLVFIQKRSGSRKVSKCNRIKILYWILKEIENDDDEI